MDAETGSQADRPSGGSGIADSEVEVFPQRPRGSVPATVFSEQRTAHDSAAQGCSKPFLSSDEVRHEVEASA